MQLTRRKLLATTIVAPLAAASVPQARAAAQPSIVAYAGIVVDASTGDVLFTKRADDQRQVASTQKLLTALLIVEEGNIDGQLTVDRSDTLVAPVKMGLSAGERYRRKDLLRALMLRSSNDIAHSLARDNAGSEPAFARKMTERARRLGMISSRFANASGLPADQHSTARDIARLAIHVYRNQPLIREMIRLDRTSFTFSNGRTVNITNTNRLLTRLPGCNGMKTGYTHASGRCLVSSINRNGRDIIAVVLGSNSGAIWSDSQKLLEYGLKA